jgi:hypothetical protein
MNGPGNSANLLLSIFVLLLVFAVFEHGILVALRNACLSIWRFFERKRCSFTGERPREFPPKPDWMK